MDLTQPQILIEIILSILLCAGILYSFYVTRVLASLRRDKETLGNLLKSLQESINAAETGMEQLRITSEISGRPLNRLIEKAKEVEAGINACVEAGTKLEDKLQDQLDRSPRQLKEMSALIKRAQMTQTELTLIVKKQQGRITREKELQDQRLQEQKNQLEIMEQKREAMKRQEAMHNAALAREKQAALEKQKNEEEAKRQAELKRKEEDQTHFTDKVAIPSTTRLSQDRPYLRALRK